ncbi:MAG: Lar family restriction alleviation protein [Bacteroidales bacterium]|nr:Lar family restriction alleviation protein [Bacteroidales bacterium]
MQNSDLPKCPFCGGEAEYNVRNYYLHKGWRVRCAECGCSTRPVMVNLPRFTYDGPDYKTNYTEQQAKEIARNLWSCRVDKQGGKDEQES